MHRPSPLPEDTIKTILALARKGLTDEQIAKATGISVNKVKAELKRIPW